MKKTDLMELFEIRHHYIYESIVKEKGKIRLIGQYDLIKEIVIDNKVVGLGVYNFIEKNMEIILEYYYVLPEYRNKFNLNSELIETSQSGTYKMSIHNPKRETIEQLICDKGAFKLNDRFVYSQYNIFCDKVSKKFKGSLKEISDLNNIAKIKKYAYTTRKYDLELCASIIESNNKNKDIILSPSYLEEEEKYNCLEKRKTDTLVTEGELLSEYDKAYQKFKKEDKNFGYMLI